MPISTPYVLVVSMDVDPAHEDLFNEVYDTEHIPFLLEVPGVKAAWRCHGEAASMFVGGNTIPMDAPSPAYSAVYEIESPDVLTSDAWTQAVERGRWPSVRQYVSNRSSSVYRMR